MGFSTCGVGRVSKMHKKSDFPRGWGLKLFFMSSWDHIGQLRGKIGFLFFITGVSAKIRWIISSFRSLGSYHETSFLYGTTFRILWLHKRRLDRWISPMRQQTNISSTLQNVMFTGKVNTFYFNHTLFQYKTYKFILPVYSMKL